jgi:hypothetical protein
LIIPHDAVRESSLHGLGHWVREYHKAKGVINRFLRDTPDLRPELVAYAERARAGNVL